MRGRKPHGEIGGKKCLNCFRFKPVTEFYAKLDGYQSRCKACNAEVVRGYHHQRKRLLRARRWARIFARAGA